MKGRSREEQDEEREGKIKETTKIKNAQKETEINKCVIGCDLLGDSREVS